MVSKFVDRRYELSLLNKGWSREGARLIVLYGRRRVGKTRLLLEFIENKEGVPFTYALAMFTHCCLGEEVSKDEIPKYFWDLASVGGYPLEIVKINEKIIEDRLGVKL
jgi:hypothetical protein